MKLNTIKALPGALTRRDAAPGEGASWEVTHGRAARGEAWTDPEGHKMRVPGGASAVAEIIRAHEMMHAKCSPACDAWKSHAALIEMCTPVSADWDHGLLFGCEELRVNHLLKLIGYDLDLLSDGSEGHSGELVDRTPYDWNQAVIFTVATHGGRAQRLFIEGVKKNEPEFAARLIELCDDLGKVIRSFDGSWSNVERRDLWGSTAPLDAIYADPESKKRFDVTLPLGFVNIIPSLMRVAMPYLLDGDTGRGPGDAPARDVDGEESEGDYCPQPKRKDGWEALRPRKLPLTVKVSGLALGKRRFPAQRGRRVGYVSRLMTDPQRRIFTGESVKGRGVMVFDLSGSMSLDNDDIMKLLDVSPNLTIIGYAGFGPEPNAFVLAQDGRRVARIPNHNRGNACDLPALEYGQSLRNGSDPFIWVTDGRTTKGEVDEIAGVDECARFVRTNRVYVVNNMDEALYALTHKKGDLRSAHVPSRSIQCTCGDPNCAVELDVGIPNPLYVELEALRDGARGVAP